MSGNKGPGMERRVIRRRLTQMICRLKALWGAAHELLVSL